jgi:hypothetical protein
MRVIATALGLRLVSSRALQLGATITKDTREGTTVEVRFPQGSTSIVEVEATKANTIGALVSTDALTSGAGTRTALKHTLS